MTTKTAALIILNYNGQKFLDKCLSSFINQKGSISHDIFLVDNNSSDKSLMIAKKYPQIKILHNKNNLGIGAALNKAIKPLLNNYLYIGVFNSDIILHKDWLKQSLNTFTKKKDAAISTSLILWQNNNTIDNAGGAILCLPFGIFGGLLTNKPLNKLKIHQPFSVSFGLLTAMLIKTSAFKVCGLFDSSYFFYFEDIDLSWRIRLSGKRIYCQPKAIVNHIGAGSHKNNQLLLKLKELTETNLLATLYKNLPTTYLYFLLPIVFFNRFILSLFYVIKNPNITKSKIKGLYVFLLNLLKGKYKQSRSFSQSLTP